MPTPVVQQDPNEAPDIADVPCRQVRLEAGLLLPIPLESTYYDGTRHVKLTRFCIPVFETPGTPISFFCVPIHLT